MVCSDSPLQGCCCISRFCDMVCCCSILPQGWVGRLLCYMSHDVMLRYVGRIVLSTGVPATFNHMSVHMSLYLPVHMSLYLSLHIYLHTSLCMSVHMFLHISTHAIRLCIHASAHVCARACMHIFTHVCAHVRTRICMHATCSYTYLYTCL